VAAGCKDGPLGIYDDLLPDEPGDSGSFSKLILFENNQKINIYGRAVFRSGDAKPLLLKFINKRYRSSFAASDFKDERAMIDYILTRETTAEPVVPKSPGKSG
jgi:NRPS condensation-like uncharacterized protein